MDLSPNVGEDDLHAVIDGQLAADRHREVMAYLAVYPDAADRVSAFFRQRVELAALREGLAEGEPDGRLAGLEEALTRVVRRQHRARRALGAGGLLAAFAVVAASGWWFVGDRGGGGADPGAARIAATAAVEERLAVAHDLLAGGDAEPVSAAAGADDGAVLWLQAHLGGRSLKQPDLEALGLRFAGGSRLMGARGPAIRLAYADEGGRKFDLFAGLRNSGVELAASLVPEDHISLTWQQEPLVFTLVAPQSSARLREIMRSAGELLDSAPVAADAGLGQLDGDAGAAPDVGPAPALADEPSSTPRLDDGGPSKPL